MNDYRQLAIRYLKFSKKRTIRTIAGATMGVILLYMILNISYSILLGDRAYIRSTDNYELIAIADDVSVYDQIIADKEVLDAYVGQYSHGDYLQSGYTNLVETDRALYIHVKHPYGMDKYRERLLEKYDIDIYYNEDLAVTYMQSEEGGFLAVLISLVLLISMIVAIFSVGMVRDSIQLSTLEQIKDYGNLKCIGASKGQIKAIIYFEGFIIETIGIILGIIIGFIVSVAMITAMNSVYFFYFEIPVVFSIVPIVPVCVAFYFDLYFVMQENHKLVANMSPIEALKGEFRIKKEKLKIVKGNLFGKIFGIEGAYAYKNLRRNPSRFRKAVWSMGFIIAGTIFMVLFFQYYYESNYSYINQFKYYNVYEYAVGAFWNTTSKLQSKLSFDFLDKLNDFDGMEEAANIYLNSMTIADNKGYAEHLNPEMWGGDKELSYYIKSQEIMWGLDIDYVKNQYLESIPDLKNSIDYNMRYSNILLAGYAPKDISKLGKKLVSGTVDVSDHGIILVNHGSYEYEEYTEKDWRRVVIDGDYTTYKVGDTVKFLDQTIYRKRVQEAAERARKNYENETGSTKVPTDLMYIPHDSPKYKAIQDFWEEVLIIQKEMLDNGEVKEYTIEGIVSEDPLFTDEGGQYYKIIVPLENYCNMTGLTENDFVGRMFHFKTINSDKYYELRNATFNRQKDDEFSVGDIFVQDSWYPEFIDELKADGGFIVCVASILIFIIMMICINIVNISASNIYLRRREFSQLRVIGMSKKGIIKMVCLEGLIASIFANVIGITLGIVAVKNFLKITFQQLYGRDVTVSILVIVIVVLMSTAIEIGSLYFPAKRLGNQMADDLKQSGE